MCCERFSDLPVRPSLHVNLNLPLNPCLSLSFYIACSLSCLLCAHALSTETMTAIHYHHQHRRYAWRMQQALGRFLLRDKGHTVVIGVVLKVLREKESLSPDGK